MGRKKRKAPDEVKDQPWCFYCDREFTSEDTLITHQCLKHFKCENCHRRLSHTSGLAVHMDEVHKEPLKHIPNAIPERDDVSIHVYGMTGIPDAWFIKRAQANQAGQIPPPPPGRPPQPGGRPGVPHQPPPPPPPGGQSWQPQQPLPLPRQQLPVAPVVGMPFPVGPPAVGLGSGEPWRPPSVEEQQRALQAKRQQEAFMMAAAEQRMLADMQARSYSALPVGVGMGGVPPAQPLVQLPPIAIPGHGPTPPLVAGSTGGALLTSPPTMVAPHGQPPLPLRPPPQQVQQQRKPPGPPVIVAGDDDALLVSSAPVVVKVAAAKSDGEVLIGSAPSGAAAAAKTNGAGEGGEQAMDVSPGGGGKPVYEAAATDESPEERRLKKGK